MEKRSGGHDRSRYQGKRLARLLTVLIVPALILYMRVVLAIVAGRAGANAGAISRISDVLLVPFCAVQAGCAWYLSKLLKKPGGRVREALQYGGVLVMCIFCSITGAIVLEAFGYNLVVRVLGSRY